MFLFNFLSWEIVLFNVSERRVVDYVFMVVPMRCQRDITVVVLSAPHSGVVIRWIGSSVNWLKTDLDTGRLLLILYTLDMSDRDISYFRRCDFDTCVCREHCEQAKMHSIWTIIVVFSLGNVESIISLPSRDKCSDKSRISQKPQIIVVHYISLMCFTKILKWKLPKLLMIDVVFRNFNTSI